MEHNIFTLSEDGKILISCKWYAEGNIVIPDGVQIIANNAFWGCRSLTSITIPDSVTKFGNFAFWNCRGLTSVNIPNSVTEIGDGAFYECM